MNGEIDWNSVRRDFPVLEQTAYLNSAAAGPIPRPVMEAATNFYREMMEEGDARSAMLGHPQRGGTPSPIDRIMGFLFGSRAADAVAANDFGQMVSARGVAPACDLSLVPISSVLGQINTVDVERHYDTERYHLKGIGM